MKAKNIGESVEMFAGAIARAIDKKSVTFAIKNAQAEVRLSKEDAREDYAHTLYRFAVKDVFGMWRGVWYQVVGEDGRLQRSMEQMSMPSAGSLDELVSAARERIRPLTWKPEPLFPPEDEIATAAERLTRLLDLDAGQARDLVAPYLLAIYPSEGLVLRCAADMRYPELDHRGSVSWTKLIALPPHSLARIGLSGAFDAEECTVGDLRIALVKRAAKAMDFELSDDPDLFYSDVQMLGAEITDRMYRFADFLIVTKYDAALEFLAKVAETPMKSFAVGKRLAADYDPHAMALSGYGR